MFHRSERTKSFRLSCKQNTRISSLHRKDIRPFLVLSIVNLYAVLILRGLLPYSPKVSQNDDISYSVQLASNFFSNKCFSMKKTNSNCHFGDFAVVQANLEECKYDVITLYRSCLCVVSEKSCTIAPLSIKRTNKSSRSLPLTSVLSSTRSAKNSRLFIFDKMLISIMLNLSSIRLQIESSGTWI
ncbi:hypothetical protein RF11_12546 [Thelohanellus kitauei]|uniref:Uncharacterized protein n=1 Tax=Thelohanellus kitauei TaxID=669202 RepID=A0A0C2NHT1_THEKT|nr:hypothetical protein RF11_12546 [Thelohanellus kitauei]